MLNTFFFLRKRDVFLPDVPAHHVTRRHEEEDNKVHRLFRKKLLIFTSNKYLNVIHIKITTLSNIRGVAMKSKYKSFDVHGNVIRIKNFDFDCETYKKSMNTNG